MIYELRMIKRTDGLYDVYVNEQVHKGVDESRAHEIIFDADQDFDCVESRHSTIGSATDL